MCILFAFLDILFLICFAFQALYLEKKLESDKTRSFQVLDADGDGTVSAKDLAAYFKSRGYKYKMTDVEEIIWEVDEDADGGVNWPEFNEYYDRCRHDKTGLEPKRFFYVIEFSVIDDDNSGFVNIEEAASRFYLQYGKEKVVSNNRDQGQTLQTHESRDANLSDFFVLCFAMPIDPIDPIDSHVRASSFAFARVFAERDARHVVRHDGPKLDRHH